MEAIDLHLLDVFAADTKQEAVDAIGRALQDFGVAETILALTYLAWGVTRLSADARGITITDVLNERRAWLAAQIDP